MSDEIKKTGEDVDNNIDRILEERRKASAANNASRRMPQNTADGQGMRGVSPMQSGNGRTSPVGSVSGGDGKDVASRRNTGSNVGRTPSNQPGTHYRCGTPEYMQREHAASSARDGMKGRTPQNGDNLSPVRQNTGANGKAHVNPAGVGRADFREDDDIKIAVGGKRRKYDDNGKTRKTDVAGKMKSPLKKKEADVNENDIGGSLVVSMLRAVVYLVAVSVIAAVLSIFVINIGNDVYAFVKNDDSIDVTIPEGATSADVAEILYENGVIKYKSIFKLYGSIKHIEENFVAGDYTVTPMMNYKSLYNEFKEKPVSGTSWITIPEGYTTDEIIDLMLSYGIGGTKEDYVKAINEDDYDFWFVDELNKSGVMEKGERFYKLDGYLFPDTYEFYNASSAHTVINKMLQRFDEVYTDVFKQRAKDVGFTTDQAVILASIIEKEAGHSSDFRYVSSVFHNRINNSGTFPRFESDATVVYAITHITGERPEQVTHDTISYDSPYNTYLYNSFPPGAISNPGMNALKYAVYPADTNYYFFVSSSSGTTLFASSKAEHDKNVASLKQ